MYCRAALLVVLLSIACQRQGPQQPRVLAVLPFDNQSSDASLSWMGRALAEGLVLALEDSKRYRAPGVSPAAPARAVQVVHGRFSGSPDRLRVAVAVEDVGERERVAQVEVAAGSLLEAVERMARELDPAVRPRLPNPEALRYYSQALEAGGGEEAMSLLDRALAADPDFGRAYLAGIQRAKSARDRAALERYLEAAESRGAALDERVRALAAHERAALGGDLKAQIDALENLTRATPEDPAAWRSLAQARMSAAQPLEAARAYSRAAELAPEEVLIRNELGYAWAFAGNLQQATAALREYERLRPREGNPLDSLGDVHFLHRRFNEAGRFYLDAHQRQPRFLAGAVLWKAAIAFLMHGDQASGAAAFDRFRKAHAANPAFALWEAEWEALTGRRGAAIARLTPLASRRDTLGAQARGHLVVLHLEGEDRAAAQRYVSNAAPGAVVFLALPEAAPAEWQARAERIPDSPLRTELLGYALLFSKDYFAAAQAFERTRQRVPLMQRPIYAALEAWTLKRAGRRPDPSLLRFAPIPQAGGFDPFIPVVYTRVRQITI